MESFLLKTLLVVSVLLSYFVAHSVTAVNAEADLEAEWNVSHLGQRTADEKIALFCKEKNCDLMTADKTAYLHYFAAGMTSVQITKYGEETEGDKYVYIIRIVG